jgi:hypothetical protein
MLIDRRSFLTGIAASAAVSAIPTQAQPLPTRRPTFPHIAAVRFSPDTEFGVGHRAIRRFMERSCFHFDADTYPGHHLIRHQASGLVFLIEADEDYWTYARRIFLRGDPKDLSHERYLLIGNATRRAAQDLWPTSRKCGIQSWDYACDPPYHTRISTAPPMQLDFG